MTTIGEYRGVKYSIADNDDGVWRWVIYPKKTKRPEVRMPPPRPTYQTRDAAIEAAKSAIDRLLDKKPGHEQAQNTSPKLSGDAEA
jgi:hypothetical protein